MTRAKRSASEDAPAHIERAIERLEAAYWHCVTLEVEGNRELREHTTTDPIGRPLAPGTKPPRAGVLEAAHGAEMTRAWIERALEALARGEVECALADTASRLADLVQLLDRTADGFVARDASSQRGERSAARFRSGAIALKAEIYRELENADGNWSRQGGSMLAAIERVLERARVDPEYRRGLFPRGRVPKADSIAKQLRRRRRPQRGHP